MVEPLVLLWNARCMFVQTFSPVEITFPFLEFSHINAILFLVQLQMLRPLFYFK